MTEPELPAPGSDLRRAGLVALIVLAVLNVADVVITELAITRGAEELNPLGRALLSSHVAIVVKLLIVVVLAADFALRRPRLGTLCGLWLVVGVYLVIVALNTVQLVSLG